MRARRVVLAAVVIAGCVSLALYGDVVQSFPLDDTRSSSSTPILQPANVALGVALNEIGRYGGLPRDAELRGISAETRSVGSGTPAVVGYSFTWQPRGAVAWDDHIIVTVGTSVDTVCLGNGTRSPPPFATCATYDLRYRLQPRWVRRVWRPWPVRRIAEAWVRWRAPLGPPPSSLTTACAHVDITALRRVVGTAEAPNIPLGMPHRRVSWDELVRTVKRPEDVLAHWAPPYPRLAAFDDAEFSYALVENAGGFGAHLVRRSSTGSADWFFFPSAVNDPVCPPRRPAKPPVWSPRRPSWETVVAILREQAELEATTRAGSQAGAVSRVTTDAADAGPAVVRIETRFPSGDTWDATYHVDRMVPALLDARVVRRSSDSKGR